MLGSFPHVFCWSSDFWDSYQLARYTQPDPAGGDVPAHSMVLEWIGDPSEVDGQLGTFEKLDTLKLTAGGPQNDGPWKR